MGHHDEGPGPGDTDTMGVLPDQRETRQSLPPVDDPGLPGDTAPLAPDDLHALRELVDEHGHDDGSGDGHTEEVAVIDDGFDPEELMLDDTPDDTLDE